MELSGLPSCSIHTKNKIGMQLALLRSETLTKENLMKITQKNSNASKKIPSQLKQNQHGPALGPLSPKIQTATSWKKALLAQRKKLLSK